MTGNWHKGRRIGIAPLMLNLSIRCRCVVIAMAWPLHPWRRTLAPIVQETGSASRPVWKDTEERKSLPPLGFEYQTLQSAASHNADHAILVPYMRRAIPIVSNSFPRNYSLQLIFYTGWSKSLCATDDCTVIVRCTEAFWLPYTS